jgi:FkbM family methyltransferase
MTSSSLMPQQAGWAVKCRRLYQRIGQLLAGAWRDFPHMGLGTALRLHSLPLLNRIRQMLGMPQAWPLLKVRVKGVDHPLGMRTGTSDYNAYRQIFVDEEYGRTQEATDLRNILDCGANAGYASIYFLNRFPDASVICVEPDPDNAALCRLNLAPYGDRVRLIEAGVWDTVGDLVLVPSAFGGGNKWGISVRAQNSGEKVEEADIVRAVNLPTLIQLSGSSTVDLLKMDIEGSEALVFTGSSAEWLPQIRNIVIELHGAGCESVFYAALEGYDYRNFHHGDLTYCMQLSPRRPGDCSKEAVTSLKGALDR